MRKLVLTSVMLSMALAAGCASTSREQQDAYSQKANDAMARADEALSAARSAENRANEAYRKAEEALAAAQAAQQSADAANERAARMLQQSSRK